jgi:hypothetical protein
MTRKCTIKLMLVMIKLIILVILEVDANDPTTLFYVSTPLPTSLHPFKLDNEGMNYINICLGLRTVKKCGETLGMEFCVAKKLLQCLFKDPKHPKHHPISLEALQRKCFVYCINKLNFGRDHANCIVRCYEDNMKKKN